MAGNRSIWVGYDPRELDAFLVAKMSIESKLNSPIPVNGLRLDTLRERELYTRLHERRDGRLWDMISEAPMATEFAISRFLVPTLAQKGWALFVDGDVMARCDLSRMFDVYCDPNKAVYVVQHRHEPTNETKMDGQVQTQYPRKNWSSVMLFNCDHPSNKRLTVEMINRLPGRDLHRFCWLEDNEIGELGQGWNYLVGHTWKYIPDPAIVHFTDGVPSMPGYENCEFASEWFGWLHSYVETSDHAHTNRAA